MPINHLQKANEASAADLLQTLTPSSKPIIIKIRGSNYVTNIFTSSELSSIVKVAIWTLFKTNMEALYKSTRVFAWNPSKKRSELFHRTSRFLVVYPEGKDVTTLIAFAMFRFEQEDDADGRPQDVSYCYEIQVDPRHQGNGLGAILVRNLVKLASAWKMKKIMLTVLLVNSRAILFYQREGFSTDEISPDDEEYLIMSKTT